MPQTTFAIKRTCPRFSFFAEAKAMLQDGSSVSAQVSELSSRGCYIDTLEPIPIGTELHLCISHAHITCELPGKVIYMHSGYGMGIFGMGVVFGKITPNQHSALQCWLREVASSQTSRNVAN